MSLSPRSLGAYRTVWSADRNEELYLNYIQSGRAEDASNVSFTGDFNIDFKRICTEYTICPHPQLIKKGPEKEDEKKGEKKEEEKKKLAPRKKKASPEDDDKNAPVEHLQVYGWRFDLGTAAALAAVLPASRSLTSIRLWAAQARPQALHLLAEGIKDSTLQRLYLEFNPLTDEDESMASFHKQTLPDSTLVSPRGGSESETDDDPDTGRPSETDDSRPASRASTGRRSRPFTPTQDNRDAASYLKPSASSATNFLADMTPRSPGSCLVELCSSPNLQTVCLRANKIDDRVAIKLFQALQDPKSCLLSLNLWNNLIGDEAMPDLKQYLLMTRTLTAISIGHNQISEVGALVLASAFKAVFVDKEEAKRMKAFRVSVTSSKTKSFRDANTTVRLLNISRNDLSDTACEAFLECADEELSMGLPVNERAETAGKSDEKKGKKRVAKAEHGRGNKLEKIILSKNIFSQSMHIRLHMEDKIEVQPLPAEIQAKLDAEQAAKEAAEEQQQSEEISED